MIAIPILISLVFVISLWILIGSKGSWFLKILVSLILYSSVALLYFSLPSFFGWAADGNKILGRHLIIYSVVIDEPSENDDGSILMTCLTPRYNPTDNFVLKALGHEYISRKIRLYEFPYSRDLHEEIVKSIIPRLRRGQRVEGRIGKGKGKDGLPGEGEGDSSEEGDGSESQNQEYRFYELPPSETSPKINPNQPQPKEEKKPKNRDIFA